MTEPSKEALEVAIIVRGYDHDSAECRMMPTEEAALAIDALCAERVAKSRYTPAATNLIKEIDELVGVLTAERDRLRDANGKMALALQRISLQPKHLYNVHGHFCDYKRLLQSSVDLASAALEGRKE